MRRAPRQVETADELHAAAVRALMRRAHSVHELRRTLERRCRDEELISAEISRLKQQNLLDDSRYAREFARQHAAIRRQGRLRIAQELRRRGVPDRHIESALDEVFAVQDEAALVCQRLERKLRNLRGPLDERRLASLYRSLLRAGFSPDQVRTAINTIARGARLDTADAPPAEPEL
jgi:regulatory protein